MICFATIFVRIILRSWAKFEVWLHASKIIDVACNNILLFLFSTKSSYYFYVICHHINFFFCFLKWILVVIILWSINNLQKAQLFYLGQEMINRKKSHFMNTYCNENSGTFFNQFRALLFGWWSDTFITFEQLIFVCITV